MSDSTQLPEGYEVPLYLALTQPPLLGGVPREFGILTLVSTLVITLGLHMWLLGLSLGLVLHVVSLTLTRRDHHWLAVFRDHLKSPTFLDW